MEKNKNYNHNNKQSSIFSNCLSKFHTIILYLIIFSFMGWILETVYFFLITQSFVPRGFVYAPMCTIYGYGALLLTLVGSKYKNTTFRLFLYSAIVFTIFEYIVSFSMQALFNDFWWSYNDNALNVNGRVSLIHSIGWGLLSIIFTHHILPTVKSKVELLLNKIPLKFHKNLINLLFIGYLIDFTLSCVNNVI